MLSACPHVTKATGNASDDELTKFLDSPTCHTCRGQGHNYWLCLYPKCYEVGCSDSDGGQDHSTKHFQDHPTHCIQVNVTTIRAWCYACDKEITTPTLHELKGYAVGGRTSHAKLNSTRSDRAEYLAQAPDPVSSNPYLERHKVQDVGGLVGLANLGNTCYMNAALQCLSNVPALTEFFLTCSALVTKADTFNGVQREKPSLSNSYLLLLKELWSNKNGSSPYVAPSKLLFAFKAAHPMFRGYHQQDSQEFLRCFMDQIHEELMEPDNELDLSSNGDDMETNLESVSEAGSIRDENSSQDEEEEQEYETADSGVSEESTNSSSPVEPDVQQQAVLSPSKMGCRKRKHFNSLPGILDGQEPEASDGELEFIDAASSRSASPPSSTSPFLKAMPASAMSQRSPSKVSVSTFGGLIKRKPKTYRSVISDVFDGKLISSVQCLTCDRVSKTIETFQDLSLPIPSAASTSTTMVPNEANNGWFSWIWSWVGEWLYGPNISLHDCLAYFFSADELKGDNMYSCEKCKKLRNGLKYSRVTVLPDTLCIHLKRFRHDFSFSTKISSKVTFPLVDLDMAPWLHQDCISRESKYDLIGVISHHGTAGGGHYTAFALNNLDQEWYEYDDSYVTKVEPATVMNAEAYVLFYRKNNLKMEPLREEVQSRLDQGSSLVHFYISRQWLNKFENFAEPGPIDNSDFLCPHGGIIPSKADSVYDLCLAFPQSAWNYLHSTFGGGPACSRLFECNHCKEEMEALNKQKQSELETFKQLHAEFQESDTNVMYCLSSSWFKQWEQFVLGRQRDPPGQIDNRSIITTRFNDRQQVLRATADFIRVSHDIWRLFHSIYGGGPEVILKSNGTSLVITPKSLMASKHRLRSTSESTVTSTSPLSSSPPKQ